MKKFKIGFSLAEILVCVAIIAVVATLGFSITKQSVARSYDLYIYNGYVSILNAFNELLIQNDYNGENKDINPLTEGPNSEGGYDASDFSKEIIDLFRGDIKNKSDGSVTFSTPNGIKYTLKNEDDHYNITIEVPSQKYYDETTDMVKTTKSYEFAYKPSEYTFLIPTDGNDTNSILYRKDLLPAYIDDGSQGRKDSNGNIARYQYYTLKGAICRRYGSNDQFIKNLTTYACNTDEDKEHPYGVIKIANPRKVF